MIETLLLIALSGQVKDKQSGFYSTLLGSNFHWGSYHNYIATNAVYWCPEVMFYLGIFGIRIFSNKMYYPGQVLPYWRYLVSECHG